MTYYAPPWHLALAYSQELFLAESLTPTSVHRRSRPWPRAYFPTDNECIFVIILSLLSSGKPAVTFLATRCQVFNTQPHELTKTFPCLALALNPRRALISLNGSQRAELFRCAPASLGTRDRDFSCPALAGPTLP